MFTKQEAKDVAKVAERTNNLVDAILSSKLLTIVVEPASSCNLKCTYCDAHSGRAPKYKANSGLMSDETWRDFIMKLTEYSNTYGPIHMLQFLGNGEPLLNKKLDQYIDEVVSKKLAVSTRVISNGVLADRQTTQKLIDAGLDELHISLDVMDKDRFKKIRGRDQLDKLLGNLEEIIELVEECQKTELFIKYFNSSANNSFGVDEADGQAIINSFCDKAEHSRFVHLKEQLLVDTGIGHLSGKQDFAKPCEVPFYMIYVMHDGKVSACCTDVFNSMTVGHLKDDSLVNILKSRALSKIRHLHINERANEIKLCGGCGNRTAVDLTQLDTKTLAQVKSHISRAVSAA